MNSELTFPDLPNAKITIEGFSDEHRESIEGLITLEMVDWPEFKERGSYFTIDRKLS